MKQPTSAVAVTDLASNLSIPFGDELLDAGNEISGHLHHLE